MGGAVGVRVGRWDGVGVGFRVGVSVVGTVTTTGRLVGGVVVTTTGIDGPAVGPGVGVCVVMELSSGTGARTGASVDSRTGAFVGAVVSSRMGDKVGVIVLTVSSGSVVGAVGVVVVLTAVVVGHVLHVEGHAVTPAKGG